MNKFVWVVALALLPAATAAAAERPDWAFGPTTPAPAVRPPADPDQMVQVPGSTKTYTLKQLEDSANPPDWFPDEHPPMPKVVAHGNGSGARAASPAMSVTAIAIELACRARHYLLPSSPTCAAAPGQARPSACSNIAKAMTEQCRPPRTISASSRSCAGPKSSKATPPQDLFRPRQHAPAARRKRREPIGNRIVELPEDPARVALRDRIPDSSHTCRRAASKRQGAGHVRRRQDDPRHLPWSRAQGLGDVPGLAGRSPLNIARQLYYFQAASVAAPQPP